VAENAVTTTEELVNVGAANKGAPGIKFVVSYGYSVAYGPRRCCCR
jgi:hypothetical protein